MKLTTEQKKYIESECDISHDWELDDESILDAPSFVIYRGERGDTQYECGIKLEYIDGVDGLDIPGLPDDTTLWRFAEADDGFGAGDDEIYTEREEVLAAAVEYAKKSNESLDVGDIIDEILALGWFRENVTRDVVEAVLDQSTEHAAGMLGLIPRAIPDVRLIEWVTRGACLQGVDYVELPACEMVETAAVSLRNAIMHEQAK